ncbi:MAG TPA: right-handed parallel beta-helix repeat-containing protein [Anaerolineae bacterium]|nr:right-handed parallel beta-helix repeat-containing protein [Anaerolineae bacterium]
MNHRSFGPPAGTVPLPSLSCAWRSAIIVAAVLSLSAAPQVRAQGRIVPVADAAALTAAVAAAQPGDTIVLAGGDYLLRHKLNLVQAGRPDAPITLRAAALGEARLVFSDATGVVEGLHVQAPDWVLENLNIEGRCGADDNCEHALHIVGQADRTVLRGSRLHGFNAQIKGNGMDLGGATGWVWPDDVLTERTEFFNPAPRQTDNPVTPIDVVGGRRWIVRDNFIHDHAKGGGDGISYAAFLKGNSRDGLFERNLVVCELLHKGRTRLGLSFGGGGSGPDRICEEGTCTPEHQGGIMRNNLILHCPADVGIYLNEAADSQVLHNTLYDTGGGIDIRFAASSVTLIGNLLPGRIRDRDGGRSVRDLNREGVTAAQWAAWFADAGNLDFRLKAGAEIADSGRSLPQLPDDYCGAARADGRPDLGAVELGTGCDTRPAAWAGLAAGPGATPTVAAPTVAATAMGSATPTGVATGTAGATSTAMATAEPTATRPVATATATRTVATERPRLLLPRLGR